MKARPNTLADPPARAAGSYAEIGFAMEARLLKRGARVRGWPPRGRAE